MAKTRKAQNTYAQGAADLVNQMARIENKLDLVLAKLDKKEKKEKKVSRAPSEEAGHTRPYSNETIPMRGEFRTYLEADGYSDQTAKNSYPSYVTSACQLTRLPRRSTPETFFRNTTLDNIGEFIEAIPNIDGRSTKEKGKWESAAKAYKKFLRWRAS